MANAFSLGAEAMLAQSDSPMPRVNDSHAFHCPVARGQWPAFQSSMVAVIN